jgi:putative transposase
VAPVLEANLLLSVVGVTLRTKANIAFTCGYHVVWCPKYRRRVIGGRMEVGLTEVIAAVVTERGRG